MFRPYRLRTVIRPDLVAALRRFPVPAAAALVAMVANILQVEDLIPSDGMIYGRVSLGACAAFALGVASRIWLEAGGRLAAIVSAQLAAAVLGIFAAYCLLSLWLTPTLLIAALAFLICAAPGLAAGGTPVRFWLFNIRSIFAAIVGAVGAVAFVLGCWAILETLNSLFDLTLPRRLVLHATTIGFAFVLPLYWLALQPVVADLETEEPAPDALTRAIGALVDFIFLPLLIVYVVILHFYAAKIAVEATLPRGQIGWIVSIFLALGYSTFLCGFPQRSSWPRLRALFRRIWPPVTVVPVVLLAVALAERVDAYGITEDRYVIGVIAVAAALLFLAWLPRQRLDLRLVPIVAAVLLLVGAVGPFAARNLTVHSQAQRFVAVLEHSGELRDGRFDGERSTPWGENTKRDLQDIINLLETRAALHLIAPYVGEDLAADPRELRARLGFARPTVSAPVTSTYVRIDSDILLNRFTWWASASQRFVFRAPDGPDYTLTVQGRRVVLSAPDQAFTFDLSAEPALEWGASSQRHRVIKADQPRAALILRSLSWNGSGETLAINRLEGDILLRSHAPLP